MNELSRIDADDRDDREATRQEKRLQRKRFTAALAFTVAACNHKGMATDDDITYAIFQADRLIKALERVGEK